MNVEMFSSIYCELDTKLKELKEKVDEEVITKFTNYLKRIKQVFDSNSDLKHEEDRLNKELADISKQRFKNLDDLSDIHMSIKYT